MFSIRARTLVATFACSLAPAALAQSLDTVAVTIADSDIDDIFSERNVDEQYGTDGVFASSGVSTGASGFARATATYGSLKTLVDASASDPELAIAQAEARFSDVIVISADPDDFPFTAITVILAYRFDGSVQISGDAEYNAQFRVTFESDFDVNETGSVAFTTTVGESGNGNPFQAQLNAPFVVHAEMRLQGSATDGRALVDLENTGALTGVTVKQGPNVVAPALYTVTSWSGEFAFSPACPPDVNGDGVLDNGDIAAFVQLFLAGDLTADFNPDGVLDNGDIAAFVQAFLAAC
ncbi:MAG: GC-type dockerin domain-anchored protein [Phycisphaerales bacterium JB040]